MTIDKGGIAIELDQTEGRAIQAALFEVCSGFRIDNFYAVIGATEHQVRKLLDRLDELNLAQKNQINVSVDDLRIINSAHRETLRELGVEEYSTRTGVEFGQGQALARKLDALIAVARPRGSDESKS